ncbi:GntR family transcriptional regulator [Halobacillus karajensis]|uniref:Carbon starvation induced regulator n=1 Tax=Halobacillus karajensis TaxID=195088 RepID=A0A059NY97_9BACI|nr:GntR family transcriptional regulator [Halobacillus karajensis]CDQ18959.1 Carbon starvation induced regulator [Halobacillus karajensis]CDQ22967.1 Carbon starvation induced regulator [Halobacillus karajensis]CDQ26450.1 Carbon starvation induced regulator [Halobacillus karajensis]
MSAYEYIKKAILHGEFPPKMRLTEEFLAKKLQISRTPIREALKQLETEGLTVSMKRGVRVRHFTELDIKQIYDLRTLLEGYAAAQAAIHRTDSDLQEMVTANEMYESAIDRYLATGETTIEDILNINHRFHDSVIKASKNQHIHSHISKVIVVPLIFRSFYWFNADQLRHSLEVHKTILKAIEEQDTERARVAMHEHIYHGRDQVMKHIETIDKQYTGNDEKSLSFQTEPSSY